MTLYKANRLNVISDKLRGDFTLVQEGLGTLTNKFNSTGIAKITQPVLISNINPPKILMLQSHTAGSTSIISSTNYYTLGITGSMSESVGFVWNALCWSEDTRIVVSVGDSGKIATSADNGNTWSIVNTQNEYKWSSVVWVKFLNRFVTVGYNTTTNAAIVAEGTVIASTVNWSISALSSTISANTRLVALTVSPQLRRLIAVGYDGVIFIGNPDINNVIVWSRTTYGSYNYKAIEWSPELTNFVLVADNAIVAGTSDSSVSWTSYNLPGTWENIIWVSELSSFVICGGTTIKTSVNITDWTTITTSSNLSNLKFVFWNKIFSGFIVGLYGSGVTSALLISKTTLPTYKNTVKITDAINSISVGNVYVTGDYYASNGEFFIPPLSTTTANSSYWTKIGTSNNIYYNLGNVGLGTNNPTNRLQITGTLNSTSFTGGNLNLSGDISASGNINVSGTTGTIGSVFYNSAGNIGIKTTSPEYTLDVNGDIRVAGDIIPKTGGINLGSSSKPFNELWLTGDTHLGKRVYLGTSAPTPNIQSDIISGPNVDWTVRIGGTGGDYSETISVDNEDNIIISGYYASPTINFYDNANLSVSELNQVAGTGNSSAFVAKYSTSGSLIWRSNIGSTSVDIQYSTTTLDKYNNIYVAGYFNSIASGTLNFYNTAGSIAGTNITVADNLNDIFIAKYTSAGNLSWKTRITGDDTDYISDITCDNDGNLYAIGHYSSSLIQFWNSDGMLGRTLTIPEAEFGRRDIFVVRYTPTGNVSWVVKITDIGSGIGVSVATDITNNVYITGSYISNLSNPKVINIYNSTGLIAANLPIESVRSKNILVCKYSPGGTLMWCTKITGNDDDESTKIISDKFGNILLSGNFISNTLNFFNASNLTTPTTTLSNSGTSTRDAFLVKYSGTSGAVIWKTKIGGDSDGGETIVDINTDIDGDICVVGNWINTALSLYDTSNNIIATIGNIGVNDSFVCKYSGTSGNLLSYTHIGGTGAYSYANGVSFDNAGNLIISGYINGTVNFYNQKDRSIAKTITSNQDDMFITKYTFESGLTFNNLTNLTVLGNSSLLGNVGIGTTAPSAKLDIVGSVRVSSSLNVASNTNTIGNFFTTGGNVGIGTTAPSAKLDIVGDIRVTDTITLTSSQTQNVSSLQNISSGILQITGNSGNFIMNIAGELQQVGVRAGKMTKIATGSAHSLALDYFTGVNVQSRGVSSWGINTSGQLGNGSTTQQNMPILVTGGNLSGVCVTNIACGDSHSLALDALGQVYSWGANASSQLGNGNTTQQLTAITVTGGGLNNSNVVSIAGGSDFSLALDITGQVYSWGANGAGQLGNGTTTASTSPIKVTTGSLSGQFITGIAAGGSLVSALDTSGRVHSWGGNQTTPVLATGGSLSGVKVISIECGSNFYIALDTSGRVHTWGTNSSGQLGNGTTIDQSVPILVTGGSLTGRFVTGIAGGGTHALALDSSGRVHAWGGNGSGQLGDNSTTQRTSPFTVTGGSLSSVRIASVAAGTAFSLAVDSLGQIHGWGANASGQLGDNSTTQRTLPVLTQRPTLNFTAQHNCILDTNGLNGINSTVDLSGLIVVADKNTYSKDISINEALPVLSLSRTQKDKRVFGVISSDSSGTVNWYLQSDWEQNPNSLYKRINGIGEGGIWVCDENGPLESGDYITSSSIPGYGMRQTEPFMCNYTVAKITCDCNFIQENTQVNQITIEENGQLIFQASNQELPNCQIRYINQNGMQITKQEYNNALSVGDKVYTAQFVGCTYHCS